MHNASFWNAAIRFRYRKVGGLHFFAIGLLTLSFSISKKREG